MSMNVLHGDGTSRSRSHPKSRRGCGNCKNRKIKCDERRPACKRCEIYGVSCNFNPKSAAFQPLPQHGFMHTLHPPPRSENRLILDVITWIPGVQQKSSSEVSCGARTSWQSLELLEKFQRRTVLTIGMGTGVRIYQNAFAKLTSPHPFLMHIVFTLTLMHDQHLDSQPNSKLSAAIAFHWSQGASLLNERLTNGIMPSERDALWACSGLLGALSFASCSAASPEEAWPLKPHSAIDLDWLKMSDGKKAIWKIADPMRTDSIFYPMMPNYLQFATPVADNSDLQTLPPELLHLCGLDISPVQVNNPYLPGASYLARMIGDDCTEQNFGIFLGFLGCLHPNFRQLLYQKDPCALLFMAYWYAIIFPLQDGALREWWMYRRTFFECKAICKYLELYHGHDSDVMSIVQRIRTRMLGVARDPGSLTR